MAAANFVAATHGLNRRLIIAAKDALHVVTDSKDTEAKNIAVEIEQAQEQRHGEKSESELQLDGFSGTCGGFGDTGAMFGHSPPP